MIDLSERLEILGIPTPTIFTPSGKFFLWYMGRRHFGDVISKPCHFVFLLKKWYFLFENFLKLEKCYKWWILLLKFNFDHPWVDFSELGPSWNYDVIIFWGVKNWRVPRKVKFFSSPKPIECGIWWKLVKWGLRIYNLLRCAMIFRGVIPVFVTPKTLYLL